MALLRRGDLSVTEVCFAVGCSSLGTFSSRFTELVGVPPSVYRRHEARATAGMPSCVAKQVTKPIRNREASAGERNQHDRHGHHDQRELSCRTPTRTRRWPSIATPSASRCATTSDTAECAGSRSAPPTSPTHRSSSRRRAPTPASPTRSAARSRDDGQGHLRPHHPGHRRSRRRLRAAAAGGAEVVQEPTEQPYGIRDCAFRDPAGNLIRISELR